MPYYRPRLGTESLTRLQLPLFSISVTPLVCFLLLYTPLHDQALSINLQILGIFLFNFLRIFLLLLLDFLRKPGLLERHESIVEVLCI